MRASRNISTLSGRRPMVRRYNVQSQSNLAAGKAAARSASQQSSASPTSTRPVLTPQLPTPHSPTCVVPCSGAFQPRPTGVAKSHLRSAPCLRLRPMIDAPLSMRRCKMRIRGSPARRKLSYVRYTPVLRLFLSSPHGSSTLYSCASTHAALCLPAS